jgi:hypothetical protein
MVFLTTLGAHNLLLHYLSAVALVGIQAISLMGHTQVLEHRALEYRALEHLEWAACPRELEEPHQDSRQVTLPPATHTTGHLEARVSLCSPVTRTSLGSMERIPTLQT